MVFGGLWGMFSSDRDRLGTNTLVYVKGRIVLREPSVVAAVTSSKSLAVGVEAKKMLGRTPATFWPSGHSKTVSSPISTPPKRCCAISSRRYIIARSSFAPASSSVPSGITGREACCAESAESAGVREVYLIEEPMAAAIGAGHPLRRPRGI